MCGSAVVPGTRLGKIIVGIPTRWNFSTGHVKLGNTSCKKMFSFGRCPKMRCSLNHDDDNNENYNDNDDNDNGDNDDQHHPNVLTFWLLWRGQVDE